MINDEMNYCPFYELFGSRWQDSPNCVLCYHILSLWEIENICTTEEHKECKIYIEYAKKQNS